MLTQRTLKRIAIGVIGFIVVVAGILLIPLPGPGLLVVIAGLSILALEFAWAKRWLDWTKEYARRAKEKMSFRRKSNQAPPAKADETPAETAKKIPLHPTL